MKNTCCCSNEEKVTSRNPELEVPGQKSVSHYGCNEIAMKRRGEKRNR